MSLEYHWYDVLGNLGFVLIVGSYLLLQLGRMSGQSTAYSALNALGAAFILTSLYFEFNLSAVLVEAFWLAISLVGLALSRRKASAPGATVGQGLVDSRPRRDA